MLLEITELFTEEVSTWSPFNLMYQTPKPLLSASKRNVVTVRSFDPPENPSTA